MQNTYFSFQKKYMYYSEYKLLFYRFVDDTWSANNSPISNFFWIISTV